MGDIIAPPQSDNEALRRIVADLDFIIRLIGQDYTVLPGGLAIPVSDQVTTIRAANADAIKSVIVNTGTQKAYIYEDGKMVAIIYPDQTWESATTGKFALSAQCPSTKSTTLSVATYQL